MAVIVVDIDFTIANARPVVEELAGKYSIGLDEWESFWAGKTREEKYALLSEWYTIVERKRMEPVENAAESLRSMADRGYSIIYLTARDEEFDAGGRRINVRDMTEKWLRENSFPDGMLIMNKMEKGLVFKARTLSAMRLESPAYGIGDTRDDMIAYLSAGLKPILFHNHLHSFYNKPELFFSTEIIHMERWEELEELIRRNPFVERHAKFDIDGKTISFPSPRLKDAFEEAGKAVGKFIPNSIEFKEREKLPGLVEEWTIIRGTRLHNS